jgi:phage protein D
MPEPVFVSSESAAFGNFRAPQFKVLVPGLGLRGDVVRDVMHVSYHDSLKQIDGFDLTVNNWDASARTFKFVGAETAATLQESGPQNTPLHRLFEPSNKTFEVKMGYMDNLTTMVKGHCTTLEPSFPGGDASTLSGRGLNVLHSLRRKQYSDTYRGKKPSEIAREISQKNDPQTHRRRFPIPIDVDSGAMGREHPIEYLSQRNQYDIDFLFGLARRQGYVVYINTEQSHLYFGPSTADSPQALREVTYILKWGVTLMDFRPTLNAANQVKSVTVRGLNRRTGRRISETVTLRDAGIRINRDLLRILEISEPREEEVVNEPVPSETAARDRALAILLEKFKEFVTATGTTVGLPDLRAGMQVKIEGVGSRFSGMYFVTESTHTINDSGYQTKFKIRREDPGGGPGAG